MSRPIASNPLDVCGIVVATCIGSALKRQIQNLCRTAATASKEKETSSSIILRLQPCERRNAKENSTTSSQEIPWEDILL
jgi:hypothetical protein